MIEVMRYRESTIAHLQTSISMDWYSLGKKLCEGRLVSGCAVHELPSSIYTRCGDSACEFILECVQNDAQPDFALMCSLQSHILNIPSVAFRTASACMDLRAERYAYFSGLPALFAGKIQQDAGDNCHPFIKAVRLYLDIIFVHPFNDGNTRAALLWFCFFCLKYRLPLANFKKVLGFHFKPGNKYNYIYFASMLVHAAGNTTAGDNHYVCAIR